MKPVAMLLPDARLWPPDHGELPDGKTDEEAGLDEGV